VCPTCGLALPAGSVSCPECGRAIAPRPPDEGNDALLKRRKNRRTTWLGVVGWSAALAVGVFLFQFGYGSIYLASILPLSACGLLYVWERGQGLRPGWQFYALSAMAVVVGVLYGFIFVLVPVVIYFLWIRRRTNRERTAAMTPA
jgi:hypothetical protein